MLALLVSVWTALATGGAVEVPVTPAVATELERALTDGLRRFEAMDEAGVLANISERYQSGPLNKPLVRQQLRAIYAAHDAVWARVQIREIRMIGNRAWVSSSGRITGRLRFLGTHVTLYSWTDAWDVAWREGGRWTLIGDRG
jgi:hypothetical protein